MPTQHNNYHGMYAFIAALLFFVAIAFAHFNTKSQVQDATIAVQDSTKVYVQQQQDILLDRVEKRINVSIDALRAEQARTNDLVSQVTQLIGERLIEPSSTSTRATSNGNTSSSTSSVVNTPSTTLQTR
ncbi:hypothetical protein ACSFE6_04735 [Pseudomonas baetica]|uniref:hypothetical protein n=1 Tax=Pseudomonas baetica TaxID=674054 RepID=UPI003EEC19DE